MPNSFYVINVVTATWYDAISEDFMYVLKEKENKERTVSFWNVLISMDDQR